MKPNPYEVSDYLLNLCSVLAKFEAPGLTVTSEGVAKLRTELRAIAAIAKTHENETLRHRWNEQGRADRDQTEKVLAAIEATDSNVKLFPVMSRPAFHQDPKGAA